MKDEGIQSSLYPPQSGCWPLRVTRPVVTVVPAWTHHHYRASRFWKNIVQVRIMTFNVQCFCQLRRGKESNWRKVFYCLNYQRQLSFFLKALRSYHWQLKKKVEMVVCIVVYLQTPRQIVTKKWRLNFVMSLSILLFLVLVFRLNFLYLVYGLLVCERFRK